MDDSKAYVEKGMDACLVLTLECDHACRHCMYSCSPLSGGSMDVGQACHAIDQFNQSRYFDGHVSLAGGEPFRVYDTMRRIMSYGHERYGNTFTLSTNGSWAVSARAAEQALGPLAESGLSALQISLDDFHLHYGRVESVCHAIVAAKARRCEVAIQTIYAKGSRRKPQLADLLPAAVARLVDRWTESSVIPVGRAATDIGPRDLPDEWRNATGMCTMFLTWTVMPAGEVSPCCSANLSDVMPFGNVFTEDLEDILARHNIDPVLNAIGAHGGPYMLLKVMKKLGVGGDRHRIWSNNCHACLDTLGNKHAVGACREYLAGWKRELLLLRLHNSEQMLRYQHQRLAKEDLSFPELDVETGQFF